MTLYCNTPLYSTTLYPTTLHCAPLYYTPLSHPLHCSYFTCSAVLGTATWVTLCTTCSRCTARRCYTTASTPPCVSGSSRCQTTTRRSTNCCSRRTPPPRRPSGCYRTEPSLVRLDQPNITYIQSGTARAKQDQRKVKIIAKYCNRWVLIYLCDIYEDHHCVRTFTYITVCKLTLNCWPRGRVARNAPPDCRLEGLP